MIFGFRTSTVETPSAANVADLSRALGYRPAENTYDEMLSGQGAVRRHWAALADWFATASPAELAARARVCDRQIAENFSDPRTQAIAPWQLDIMPTVIDAATWQELSAAALQRARLYEALLADLYGPQSVFASGCIPPAAVLNDPSFLRPLYGIAQPSGYLDFLALDLARDPGGTWRVLDAHAETPAGHGFVLANRMITVEASPDLFKASGARQIGGFYRDLTEDLQARTDVDDPLIAVMTRGPGDAATLGDAYLARYLGILRVQGADLRVVGPHAYLKTVDGLKRIDLLLRAVAGHRSDPIELSQDGFDGPVGLVQACRENPRLVANTLGAAAIENRALSPFLSGIARHLLGEDLLASDSPRIWLGEARARDDVIANIDEYILHDAHEGTGRPGEALQGINPQTLDGPARAALAEDLRINGVLRVAERPVGFATTPTWSPEGLRAEPFALRVFMARINGEFRIMPGGLSLTIDGPSAVALTSSSAKSHDVWVVGDAPLATIGTLRRMARENSSVQRHAKDLQSGTADNLFWLGRYCERAEATLRIVRQAVTSTGADLRQEQQYSSARDSAMLRHILRKDIDVTPEADVSRLAEEPDLTAVLREICNNTNRLFGLPTTISNIRFTLAQCRDRLSVDAWRALNSISIDELRCPAVATPDNIRELSDACTAALSQLAAFSGMTHESMTRNRGWLFLDLGRRVERAQQLAEVLRTTVCDVQPEGAHAGDEYPELSHVLGFAVSYMTYRARYRFAPELKLVLDLLIVDETNPRALSYQLAALSEQITALPKSSDDAVRAPDQRLALDLLTRVRLSDVEELAQADAQGRLPALTALLDGLIADLPQLTEHITRQYFSLADEQPQRQTLRL